MRKDKTGNDEVAEACQTATLILIDKKLCTRVVGYLKKKE